MTNKRTIKAGDLLYITKLSGTVDEAIVTALEDQTEDNTIIRFAPSMGGDSLLDTSDKDASAWQFADEYAEQAQKEYDDEALMPSYSEVATSLEDFTGVGITPESLAFESNTDKTLKTITPASLSFNEYAPKKDAVNHPDHYTTGKTEVIDILEDLASRYDNPVDAYLVATAAKYLFRSPFKGAQEQDIRKAVWYLTRLADNIAKRNEL
ncbi:DUF3310 domain-containing protein [Macrococcus capreoli]|uniref:DUF3310 domain-containing protein n=1 Tax=Macrococcus capreoli TaxID=2982690 RepID=UPI0021D598B3|nr:DUF3310 domain-containing protein [Macrococcus sp. TMW 2.2395]MCU7556556.1 DUF3310 domain-containing protein [Macrococcus sp. TMW 2.2395]